MDPPRLMTPKQVAGVARQVFVQSNLVLQLCPLLDWDSLLIVTQDLVMSYLDCCNMFYMGLALKTTLK